jgi:hypothetical protein
MILVLFCLIIIAVIAATVYALLVPGDGENYQKCPHCWKRNRIEDVKCRFCRQMMVEISE